MRTASGGIASALVALVLGVLVATHFGSQEAFSRSLQLETPASLTTLIANLAEKNGALREEIFDLRLRVELAQEAIAGGRGSLAEAERQVAQLRVFAAEGAVRGPGIAVRVDGAFDDRALGDLVNELRNAGAEAIAVNDIRVGPRSWFGLTADRTIAVDGAPVRPALTVRAIGAPEVMETALARTGGILGQLALIYPRTRFGTSRESALELPALTHPMP